MRGRLQRRACSRPRRGRSSRDAQPGNCGQAGLSEAGYRGGRVAGLGEAGLCETPSRESVNRPASARPATGAGYRDGRVPGLAEPGLRETPSREWRTGRPQRGRLQGRGCSRARRARSSARRPAGNRGQAGYRGRLQRRACTRARRARSLRDAQPGIADRSASARPATGAGYRAGFRPQYTRALGSI